MKNNIDQVKLGAFTLGGIVLFMLSMLYLGREENMFSKTFTVHAVFKNVEGLQSGDNVWLSGVKIGQVHDVDIVADGMVIVEMMLKENQNQFITRDATASVGSDGLVGNKLVVIRPGKSRVPIQDNDTLNSMSPADTQEVLNVAKEVGDNTKEITDDLKLITRKIAHGDGIVGEILNDGEIVDDLRTSVKMLVSAAARTNQAAGRMNVLLEDIHHGQGLMTHLLTDSSYTDSFEQSLKSFSEASENAKLVTEDLKLLSSKINDENNLLHVIISDTASAQDLRDGIASAQSASDKLDENMTAMRSNFLLRKYFRNKEGDE